VTEAIIKAFYHVYNKLGTGFVEKVYENALIVTLRKANLKTAQQVPIGVYFEGELVGEFFADLVVEDKVIVENKVLAAIGEAQEAQLTNYLRATQTEVGLLLNFGPKPEYKRKVYTNDRKVAPKDDAPF
jgi:GxxExxY protein